MIAVAVLVVANALGLAPGVRVEEPYDFRERLSEVHVPNLRDAGARCGADELSLEKGVAVSLPHEADALTRLAAEDFVDFLAVSMDVRPQVAGESAKAGVLLSVRFDPSLEERRYRIETTREGVTLVARESRALAQAFYRLEDRMGLRGGPFLKLGTENRRPRFAVRMTHSGWAEDVFPDAHLRSMAHRGLTAILVYVSGVDKTKGREPQDVADLIRRAKRFGLDTYLYSFVDSFAHPRDPGGREALERAFGEIATRFAEAKGVVFVGESAQFPTKDPRAQPLRWQDRKKVAEARAKGDWRRLAGWFPCADYPEWLGAVKEIFRRQSPELDVVLWTYNWGSAEKTDRLALIDALPKDVSLMATFEMFERHRKRNGLVAGTADYSLSFAGPGKYFASEAEKAHELGLRLYAQANAAGRTWDFGTAPYEPCPWQWNRRWQALVKAHDAWGLSGIMECHHYGWWPSFVSELENEAYVEGGTPFEEHVRAIAARDYGAANAERVMSVWRRWSDLAADYVASDDNQYGPFRIGPAYPYSIGGPRVTAEKFPVTRAGSNGISICRLNYLEKPWSTASVDPKEAVPRMKAELELFEPMVREYDRGADFFAGIASGLDARRAENARRMSVLARYLARTVETAVNLKRGALAHFAGDRIGVLDWARREYANARATLPLVDADSRLGWEPSMEYVGGRAQIEWKLALMEETYGRKTLESASLRQ